MKDPKPKSHNNSQEQKSSQIEYSQQNPIKKPRQITGTSLIVVKTCFIAGICASFLLQRHLTKNWQEYSIKLFGFHHITLQSQKYTVLKMAIYYIAILELILVFTIMILRILFQQIRPVAEADPLSISLLNRILMNNIQQSISFFGLYSYLLLSDNAQSENLQNQFIFALPLLFIIGRVVYQISYTAATIVEVSTIRTVGFYFVYGRIFKQTDILTKFYFG